MWCCCFSPSINRRMMTSQLFFTYSQYSFLHSRLATWKFMLINEVCVCLLLLLFFFSLLLYIYLFGWFVIFNMIRSSLIVMDLMNVTPSPNMLNDRFNSKNQLPHSQAASIPAIFFLLRKIAVRCQWNHFDRRS